MITWLKHLLVGRPLDSSEEGEQKLSKKAALAVFASDSLSSTAYATEAILLALVAAGTATFQLAVPAAIMIIVLLWIVVISYGQTLETYPTGGGAYTVAKENLGVYAALVGGAALLIDYILTVAVSVAAGIAAITSAFPSMFPHRVALCLLAIGVMMWLNLRGVKESAGVLAGPVYLFIAAAYGLCVIALFVSPGSAESLATPVQAAATSGEAFSFFILLKAFASGCTALTGVEAVANGVQAFKEPAARNAKITQMVMGVILGSLFLGITAATAHHHLSPVEGETILSQLARLSFGHGTIYYIFQAATMGILVLAANTAFAGFPRLTSYIASDRFLPRQFANLGDRLVFSNGIIFLGFTAAALVVLYDASEHNLIPLYTVGVFVAFTLSQAGMVAHWWRVRGNGYIWRMCLNGLGAFTTSTVLVIVAAAKFTHGAWMVLVTIPALVWMFMRIRRHYFEVATELSVATYDRLSVLRHTVVVPVPGVNRASLGAIEYARSLSKDVLAVQVNVDNDDPEKLIAQWQHWVEDVPLIVLNSPYRSMLKPLLRFIDEVGAFKENDVVTVLLPEFVPSRWWHRLLHNQNGLILRGALSFKPNVVVTSVRRHMKQ
ncbi:MAG: APC family permease [Acidobacteria bacterium]|nr:APC family permease [Acidobacteriota bacterium]